MPNPYIPDRRPFPDDYVTWAAKKKRWYLKLDQFSGPGSHTWVLTSSIPGSPHSSNKSPHYSSFMLLPISILTSVNWRRLVAAHIKACRFAIRRLDKPWTIDESKKPKLPYPP